ncbi:MAG: 4Fe-4S dicluster domain-containing protein [Bacillota bacterium]|nr:4Fe-4S dicluster domain-containing protein [Bacillota bacterium]
MFIDVSRCLGCKSCELACAVAHSGSRSLFGALYESVPPRKRVYVHAGEHASVPINCRHCQEAGCAAVCPTGAMYQEAGTGTVLHDPGRCLGCGFCEMACPFGVITRSPGSKIVAKCDRCLEREIPACVEACPTGALLFITSEEAQQMKRQSLAAQFFLPRTPISA